MNAIEDSSEMDSTSRMAHRKNELHRLGPMWYSWRIVKRKIFASICLSLLCGCSTRVLTPGPTLLSGITQYQSEMQRIGNAPERWPERQRAGGTLKTVVTATVGGSGEFFRLVDLDVRKREFTITMRDGSVRADRMQEMKEELIKMDEEIGSLKPVVRSQLAVLPLGGEAQQQVESAATLGLLNLAVDGFSSTGARGLDAPSTQVDQYLVTDLGSFATVRGPNGQTHRCSIYDVPDEGAGIRCETVK
jgi:hypothetical protein